MRIVQYGQLSETTLGKVANEYDIDREKLWDMYLAIMRANFEQDLYDIAKENEEELRGVYEWKN